MAQSCCTLCNAPATMESSSASSVSRAYFLSEDVHVCEYPWKEAVPL
ncbi:LSU ribosomal protein L15P [Giardia duodenalis]|uniref:LSU ribosomal protein L15P n=1 Tax=Giardia intestinalis TaxID=5741 RepID=V6TZ37_GIAIN|nr:LSU ribosomal protein L15P [Giardia intestinalis]ESU43874.1 LSU ribosomal protein L15P [Giardia intestinalis]